MKALDLFFAGRPLLLLPLWSVWLVSLAYHHELAGKSFSWSDARLICSLTACGSVALMVNQLFDQQTDRLNNKVGFLQAGIVTPRQLGITSMILALLAVLLVIDLPAISLVIVGLLLALGWVYSAPPVRMKDRPILGFVSNALAIGFFPSFSVMPEITLHNAGLLGWDNPFYFSLCIGSSYLLTTIPDIEGDQSSGKRTAAVVIGAAATQWLALLTMILALILAFRSDHQLLFWLAMFATALTLLSLLRRSRRLLLAAIKLPILLLTLLAGIWYPLYGLFVVALLIATRAYYARRFTMVYPKLT